MSYCAILLRHCRWPSVLLVPLLCAAIVPASAQTQTSCDGSVKTEVVNTLAAVSKLSEAEQLKTQASLYEKFSSCGVNDAKAFPATDPFFTAVRQCGGVVNKRGSLFYEEMSCCGYDPQRRTFGCPIKVKQNFGFGPSPLPGSREFVKHCVQDAAGVFQPVGFDSVHLSDSTGVPTWQFAVIANAVTNLPLLQPMNGATRVARSILSWNLVPTTCNYLPVWGVSIDYRIRLDQ